MTPIPNGPTIIANNLILAIAEIVLTIVEIDNLEVDLINSLIFSSP
ncbi:MAG: hypothetical protein UZ05_CHB002002499 [Chlorobi bacterium OLB5]|nr:MAG: hypothetical protein UZ05_CHB002002499 [Chlorobi bacterium OLB5]